jgi:spore maturation protein SpmA
MASSNLLGLRGNAASIPRLDAVSEILLLNKRSSTAARTVLVTFASVL